MLRILPAGNAMTVGPVNPWLGAYPYQRLGISWVALCCALALHIYDEAHTGFLAVYNPTVLAMRQRFGFCPIPTFQYRAWLDGLIFGVIVLFALSPFVFTGARWIRPLFYVFAVLMLLNGLGHIAGTIAGRTIAAVHFRRPMPGFYSSPLLIAAALYALVQLYKSRVHSYIYPLLRKEPI